MKKEFIEGGRLVGTHGVRGTFRVQPWCDTPEFLCGFKKLFLKKDAEYEAVKIKSSKPHGNVVLMDIEGIDTIEAAEKLRNKIIYISRKDLKLDDGSYLICDLIGCEVIDADSGDLLGNISDVSKTGANDVWHIKRGENEYLIPVIDEVVLNVDIDGGKVTVRPLKGIFEE